MLLLPNTLGSITDLSHAAKGLNCPATGWAFHHRQTTGWETTPPHHQVESNNRDLLEVILSRCCMNSSDFKLSAMAGRGRPPHPSWQLQNHPSWLTSDRRSCCLSLQLCYILHQLNKLGLAPWFHRSLEKSPGSRVWGVHPASAASHAQHKQPRS